MDYKQRLADGIGTGFVILSLTLGVGGCDYLITSGDAKRKCPPIVKEQPKENHDKN